MSKIHFDIILSIINDPAYDQRMQRICKSLSEAGYKVLLVGRKIEGSPEINVNYEIKTFQCFFKKSILLYIEFNLKLFFNLIKYRSKAICAIDLDTVLPVLFISSIKKQKRIYDAHELFCEMTEIKNRKWVYTIWKGIEKWALPHFHFGYTVSPNITHIYNTLYKKEWITIRNLPIGQTPDIALSPSIKEKLPKAFIIYQGALNVDRGIAPLLTAMQRVEIPLVICGEGNFSIEARAIVQQLHLESKVIFMGMLSPNVLKQVSLEAALGINLIESIGDHSKYSLANKFFDYMQAGIPQICSDLPEYRAINEQYQFAQLLDSLKPDDITGAILSLLQDKALYDKLKANTFMAKEKLNWELESETLVQYYKTIL
jgi:glycosyltransferase involved in cell wall biosynthesis